MVEPTIEITVSKTLGPITIRGVSERGLLTRNCPRRLVPTPRTMHFLGATTNALYHVHFLSPGIDGGTHSSPRGNLHRFEIHERNGL
jgi:hypothetical protein